MVTEKFPTPVNNSVFDCGHEDGTALKDIMLSLWDKIIDGQQRLWLEAEGVIPETVHNESVETTIRGWIVGAERHYEDVVLEVAFSQKTYQSLRDFVGTYHPTFIRMTHFDSQKDCPGFMVLPNTYSNTRSIDTRITEYTVACAFIALIDLTLHFTQHYRTQHRGIIRKRLEAQRLRSVVCNDRDGDQRAWSAEFVDCERIRDVSEDDALLLPAISRAIENTADDVAFLARLCARGALREICDNALLAFVTGVFGCASALVLLRMQRLILPHPSRPGLPAYDVVHNHHRIEPHWALVHQQ
ncbi:hypothetical protein CYMTET_40116 [Cymbomonas tetramitiformis]|uniref:Uncharacterized protein n=1 Tax=Cymbomonas tetramitiformis TaxID=36881 RepID=A0AAE0C8M9_9CHLO|nr:hypothetical protein CYMTET_40116 [Cymbomonas tetramitiformis]